MAKARRYAPEVGQVWLKYGGDKDADGAREALKAWFKAQPTGVADRHQMPNFKLSEQELDNLIDFLRWTSASTRRAGRRRRPSSSPQSTDANHAAQGVDAMKYQSQQVAKLYFYGAMLVFTLQIAFGLLGAVHYVAPTAIPVDILPFSVARMVHTNAAIVWMLMGFFGSAFFLLPEETETRALQPDCWRKSSSGYSSSRR